ncbi:hypothetical protein E5161_14000 [Cohnella pontilimi]|uniref:NlpC/P60 domain-containing protein n=1 Tax=Cohnella pontilimi TaxID=2564100 RepID=A0A4U0F9X7_9BACL|nr:C40 family peptidase [Cohnella pontilimi]TJY41507.1 hypothetical protein E5161_14000 [Cohnella pontilimi]
MQRRYLLRTMSKIAISVWTVTSISMMLTGCVKNPGDTQDLQRRSDTVKVRSREETLARQSAERRIIPIQTFHNTGYVALPDLAKSMGFRGAWVNHSTAFGIGDHDVVWSFRTGQSKAMKAGSKVTMPGPAVLQRGILYVPVQGLQSLFGKEATFNGDSTRLSIVPRPVPHETGADGSRLPFADVTRTASMSTTNNLNGLIAYAKKYLGTKYEFGAAPYGAAGTFDCSSFTQHVMQYSGVQLPRSSNEQSRVGQPVSRDSLMPGDLLFFHVPGRYKSRSAVGHVGLYIGGGQMIHASPAQPINGVQITDLNKAYWSREFLFAKRVL